MEALLQTRAVLVGLAFKMIDSCTVVLFPYCSLPEDTTQAIGCGNLYMKV